VARRAATVCGPIIARSRAACRSRVGWCGGQTWPPKAG
jgi:hypothetical protein